MTKRIFVCYNKNIKMLNFNKNVSEFADLSFLTCEVDISARFNKLTITEVNSMATAVIMPRQGQSVESCIITKWNKQVGDSVAEGDVLFSYETDKASFEEEAKVAGTLLAILAEEGDDVPCLENVCVIGEPGEDVSEFSAAATVDGGETAPAAQEAPCAGGSSACGSCNGQRAGGRSDQDFAACKKVLRRTRTSISKRRFPQARTAVSSNAIF